MNAKTSNVINVVLIVAVAVLYILHFSSGSDVNTETKITAREDSTVAPINQTVLYYVNTDTLSLKYQYALDLDQTLKKKRDQSERKFKSEVEKFQKEVRSFQEQARFMTQEEGEKRQEELVMREQELGRLEQDLSDKLMEDQEQLNRELRNRILAYIKKTGDAKKITFVFGYSAIENNILLADDSLDLTDEILEGLNAEYAAKQESSK